MREQSQNHYWRDIILLTLFLGLLYFVLLGSRPLFVPDEGRYAEIAREMVVSGDFITPTLNYIKYFEKPILFYWFSAGMIKLTGLNLWSLRSINAILGILGCIIVYITARQLYDRKTGTWAACILGTSVLYFTMSHNISLDLGVSVFLTGTLSSFLLAMQYPLGKKRRAYLSLASVFAALAVLTKGLIGIVFPSLIILTWLTLSGDLRLLREVYLSRCIFIFLIIAAPWHIIVSLRNPEFFNFYFITQHFLRYTTLKIGHYQPVWFFIPYLILGFFPWVVFLPQAIRKVWPKSFKMNASEKNGLFILLWAGLIFIFFSFSKSKLIPYILPVVPPLAILVAHYLAEINKNSLTVLDPGRKIGLEFGGGAGLHQTEVSEGDLIAQEKKLGSLQKSYFVLLLLSLLIAIVFIITPHYLIIPDPLTAKIFLTLASSILVCGMLFSFGYMIQKQKFSMMLTTCTMSLFLLCMLAALPAIDKRSILPLANKLKTISMPGDDIVTYNLYYQDLPFYLQQRVKILNWQNELRFGMKHQATSEWMINDKTFWQHFDSKKRVFALMATHDFVIFKEKFPLEKAYLIAETTHNVLISNQPDTA